MAHPRRVYVPGAIYLVSAVGQYGQSIFAEASDRVDLGQHVAEVVRRCGAQVHAFKWLDDEILMVLQVHGVSLSRVMQRVTSTHARRVNPKLGNKGWLFQRPYRYRLLEGANNILEAVATIHRPPLSRWSSHEAYLGLVDIPWLTTRVVLELLSTEPAQQIAAYAALVARSPPWDVASQPGIEKRASPRGRRPYDAFVAWLNARSRERARPISLAALIGAVALWLQVDSAAIEAKVSNPRLSLARALVVWYAMKHDVATLRELADSLGRGRSTLHEMRERYRRLVPTLFNLALGDLLAGPRIDASEVMRLLRSARAQEPASHFSTDRSAEGRS